MSTSLLLGNRWKAGKPTLDYLQNNWESGNGFQRFFSWVSVYYWKTVDSFEKQETDLQLFCQRQYFCTDKPWRRRSRDRASEGGQADDLTSCDACHVLERSSMLAYQENTWYELIRTAWAQVHVHRDTPIQLYVHMNEPTSTRMPYTHAHSIPASSTVTFCFWPAVTFCLTSRYILLHQPLHFAQPRKRPKTTINTIICAHTNIHRNAVMKQGSDHKTRYYLSGKKNTCVHENIYRILSWSRK